MSGRNGGRKPGSKNKPFTPHKVKDVTEPPSGLGEKLEPGNKRSYLTDKQLIFVEEYLKDMNATRAATAAGYKNARVQAHQLLDERRNPLVAEAIQKEQALKRLDAKADAQLIVGELVKLALVNPKRLFSVDGTLLNICDIPDEVAVCISQLDVQTRTSYGEDGTEVETRTVKIRFWDKLEALRQLAQHLGLLKDIIQIGTLNQNQVVIDWNSLYERSTEPDPVEERIRALEDQSQSITPENVDEPPTPNPQGVPSLLDEDGKPIKLTPPESDDYILGSENGKNGTSH